MDKNALAAACRYELEKISGERSNKRRRSLVRSYFSSDLAKHYAAMRSLRPSVQTEAKVEQLANKINPFTSCSMPLLWWRQRKRNEGYRVVCRLPRPLHAASLLAKDVMEACLNPNDHISDWRNRGRDREARLIRDAIERGYQHCFVADVKSCFDSVKPDALNELPLPAAVIRFVLDSRNMQCRHSPAHERRSLGLDKAYVLPYHQGRSGPRGLLQGSPASNSIIAWFFNDLPSVLQSDCVLFLLADDILVLARNERDCCEIERTLTSYFAGHRAGPFALEGCITTVFDGVERAGYSFSQNQLTNLPVNVDASIRGHNRIESAIEAAVKIDADAGRIEPIRGIQALDQRLSGFNAMTHFTEFRESKIESMYEELRASNPSSVARVDTLRDLLLLGIPRGDLESVMFQINNVLKNT